jgi:2-oxoglutarate ferredoxin oxidoreductase subunit beta
MTGTVSRQKWHIDEYLRVERMPHIWCSGCGIGPATSAFIRSVERAGIDPDKMALVSGIGCAGRVAGYVRLDSFHTTHGRAIPFATGLKVANPSLHVVVFSGDGDLVAIGGNHLIHASRRNVDMTVICINNFNYGMTGGQFGPTTPLEANTSTSPYGNFDPPFNLPGLVAAAGASYVARWTLIHPRQLEKSMVEALTRPGFSFIEVVAPCPTLFGRLNKLGSGVDELRLYRRRCVIQNGANPTEVGIDLTGPVVVGKFVEIERPTFGERLRQVGEKARQKKP